MYNITSMGQGVRQFARVRWVHTKSNGIRCMQPWEQQLRKQQPRNESASAREDTESAETGAAALQVQ